MTTFATPFSASEIQQPNPTGTLGQMVQTAGGIQQFQAGALELQKAQQANTERKAYIDAMQSDPSLQPDENGMFNMGVPKNADGTPKLDPNTGQPLLSGAAKIMRMAPQTGMAIIQQIQDTNSKTTQANQSLFNLSKANMATVAEQVQAMNGMSPGDRMDALAGIKKQFPGAGPFVDQVSALYGHINSNPALMGNDKARDQAFATVDKMVTRRAMAVQEQQNSLTPSVMTQANGQQTTYTNIKAGIPGEPVGSEVTAPVQNLLTRAEQSGITTNPITGALEPWYKTPTGEYTGAAPGTKPAPGATGGGTGGLFNNVPPGESADTAKQFRDERNAAQTNAQNANIIASNNKQVLDMLKQGTTTGPGAATAQKVLGSLVGQKIEGVTGWSPKEADNLTSIQHYLDQNMTMQAKAMGVPNTNEGAEVASAVAGSKNMTTPALARAVKANDALSSGLQGYNNGLGAAIKNYKGQGDPIFASRQFKQDWANSFDPEIYKYANAVRDGDTAEQARIVADQSKGKGTDSPGWQAFQQKGARLMYLKNNGTLPPTGQ